MIHPGPNCKIGFYFLFFIDNRNHLRSLSLRFIINYFFETFETVLALILQIDLLFQEINDYYNLSDNLFKRK